MVLRYDLEQAQAYLNKIRGGRTERPALEKDLTQQAQLQARPLRARRLTKVNITRYDSTGLPQQILLGDYRRRMFVVVAQVAATFVWPDETVSAAGLGLQSFDSTKPVIVDDDTYGLVVTYPWFAAAAAFANAFAVIEEIYLT